MAAPQPFIRVAEASLISTAAPPIGRDPASHNRDVTANLHAVNQALMGSGSVLPRILTAPTDSAGLAGLPLGLPAGSVHSTASAANPPPSFAGPGRSAGPGVSEINNHLVTKVFLAAAAEKFYNSSAENIVTMLIPIVPFMAACRQRWIDNNLSGVYIVFAHTPASLKELVSPWVKANGEKLLTANELTAVILLIARIVKTCKEHTDRALAWIVHVPTDNFNGAVPAQPLRPTLFAALTEEQTLASVVEMLPQMVRIREAWLLHGFSGRELLRATPIALMEMLENFHEVVPGMVKILPHLCHRIRECIHALLFAHRDESEVSSVFDEHEHYQQHYLGALQRSEKRGVPLISRGVHGGGAAAGGGPSLSLTTPSHARDPAGTALDADAVATSSKNLSQAFDTPRVGSGKLGFMAQFGPSSGTKLYSAKADATVISGQNASSSIVIQNAAPVISDYKLFSDFNHSGFSEFLKSFREETTRLPKASRRPLKDLIKPVVIEQLKEEMGFVDWEDVTDDQVLFFCLRRFGPRTSREAKNRLESVTFYFNDATMNQDTFTSKLVKFFADKLVMLADFAHAAEHWVIGDELTAFMLQDVITALFPVDDKIDSKDGKTKVLKSSNNAVIRQLIRENRGKTFKELAALIKAHFRARDDKIAACEGSKYDIEPWLGKGKDSSTASGKTAIGGKRKIQQVKAAAAPASKKKLIAKTPRCKNCGKRGHSATKDECLLWGHPKAKGPEGTWAEDEKSLHLPDGEFKPWCETRSDFFELEKNKKKPKSTGGKAAPKVNASNYASVACSAQNESASNRVQLGSTEKRGVANINTPDAATAFHAIGRFKRDASGRAPRAASVLMDPGAEINLLRLDILAGASKASKLKILDTAERPIDLFNNGVKIGHVSNEYLLQFTLDTVDGVATQTYTAWFHTWDTLEEDAILGAEFNREACFTNYHTRLVAYKDLMPKAQPQTARPTTAPLAAPHVAVGATPASSVTGGKRARANAESRASTSAIATTAVPAEPKSATPSPATKSEIMGGGIERQWEIPHDDRSTDVSATTHHAREAGPREADIKQRCENETKLRAKHTKASAEAIAARSHHPWMCRPISRPPSTTPVTVNHSKYQRVNYNQLECEQLTAHLARSYCDKQRNLLKKLEPVGKASGDLTAEEHEVLSDAARACAMESADFYKNSAHLIGKSAFKPTAKTARYFLDEPACAPAPIPPPQPDGQGQKFPNRHVCVLQNLVNKAEMNGTAVRIISWNEDEKTYNVGISNPRGYWTCREEFLRSLDPPASAQSAPASALAAGLTFASCGIDTESGQPTLDPLERPVHRQYGKQVSAELTARIEIILKRFEDVFGKDITKPCKFRPMRIELIANAILPSNPKYWRNSPEQRKEVRNQLQSMLDMNIVRASDTAVVSNVLMVKRPGMPGKFRFTVDMRTLNDATAPMPWQMPEVQQQLDRLAGNSIFGCIDLSSYYHQIELEEGSRFLTGFITEDGVFEYNRVAMGLKNACAHAQSQLQKAIDEDPILKRYNVRNYFDDIPLAAKSDDEFCELLEAILALGRRFNLKFNREKSIFGMDSITHVGFVVRSTGVEVDAMRVDSLRAITAPQSMKGTQSVLGAWNYIRNFIPNFSSRALPLTDLVGSSKGASGKRKPKPFVWTDQCQAAFDDLKQATLDTKLLANIDFTKEIFIRTDSSQFGAGAVLFQLDERGHEHPIAYASRKYTLAERNYCTFQQEAAAVVWALEKFACFFQGHEVTVQSDHKNLSWVKKSAMPQLTRWRLRLQDFDFRLEYLPGALNVCADGLSRIGVDDKDMLISMADILPAHAAEHSLLQGKQIPHRALNSFYKSCKRAHGRRRTHTAAERAWGESSEDDSDNAPEESHADSRRANFNPINAGHADNDSDEEGELFVHDPEPVGQGDALLGGDEQQPQLPAIDAGDVLRETHNDVVGHAGVLTTLQRVLRTDKAWASRSQMIDDIDAFLSGCVTCQKFRKRHNTNKDQRFHIAGSPFSELSVDILHLPKRDCNGNLYVVVIIDSFTRWLSCVPVADKSALSAARAILQTVGNFGAPLTIRSDGGGEFVNDTLAALEVIIGIKHHKITPYLHEGNSLAEKANRSVLENLRNLIFDKRYDLNGEHQWSDLLPLAQRIINASFNSSIGCSPAQLVFGDNLELDRCLLTAMPDVIDAEAPAYIQQLAGNQRVLMDAASKFLDATHSKNLKKWKQTHKSDTSLQQMLQAAPEDGVWVLARIRDDAPLEKWKPRWAGPFRLLDFKSTTQSIVRLWDTVNNKVIESHLNDVELWNHKFTESVEGLTKVAEFDGWVYPMDGIIAMALTPDDDNAEHVPLDLSLKRTKNKFQYSFSVKWRNYEEPSWVKYNALKDTSTFQVWAALHPALKF